MSLMLKRPKQKGAKKRQKLVAVSQVQDEDEDGFEGSDTEYGSGDEDHVRPIQFWKQVVEPRC